MTDTFFVEKDLPDGWRVSDDQSAAANGQKIADLLGLPGGLSEPSGPVHTPGFGVVETVDGRLRALIRMTKTPGDAGGVVTALAFWSTAAGGRVTGADLRRLPIAELESSFTRRRRLDTAFVATAIAALGQDAPLDWDPSVPLGRSDGSDGFSVKVAAAWLALEPTSEYPTAELARLNGVSLSTAQDWVTAARRRGYLPPGRRGRAK